MAEALQALLELRHVTTPCSVLSRELFWAPHGTTDLVDFVEESALTSARTAPLPRVFRSVRADAIRQSEFALIESGTDVEARKQAIHDLGCRAQRVWASGGSIGTKGVRALLPRYRWHEYS